MCVAANCIYLSIHQHARYIATTSTTSNFKKDQVQTNPDHDLAMHDHDSA